MKLYRLILLTAFVLGGASCTNVSKQEALHVNFPPVKLDKDEYIQHITLTITGGHVVALNGFLDDWNTEVVWDHPGEQSVTLETRHFSSGLDNLKCLDGSVIVTGDADNRPVRVKAVLATQATDPAGGKERNITLTPDQLILRPDPRP